MIRTGDHFTAISRYNESDEYVFLGVNMDERPCISLYNCSTQSRTNVELAWFTGRKIVKEN